MPVAGLPWRHPLHSRGAALGAPPAHETEAAVARRLALVLLAVAEAEHPASHGAERGAELVGRTSASHVDEGGLAAVVDREGLRGVEG